MCFCLFKVIFFLKASILKENVRRKSKQIIEEKLHEKNNMMKWKFCSNWRK